MEMEKDMNRFFNDFSTKSVIENWIEYVPDRFREANLTVKSISDNKSGIYNRFKEVPAEAGTSIAIFQNEKFLGTLDVPGRNMFGDWVAVSYCHSYKANGMCWSMDHYNELDLEEEKLFNKIVTILLSDLKHEVKHEAYKLFHEKYGE